ncbi:complement decay-accelerating factor, GPI-anchored-like isoform X2 [Manis pentadactyla]|uniref:complement decay-accelerating factor, GPI-anchored-like isoform X2 n=1 Tax=Manis pentadactyla TaxID=143292 RepID=UPI00255C69A8|nr:complement decay-accelerating factor, GPI-anchored-like isoform X2 [Manis pentadactyla]
MTAPRALRSAPPGRSESPLCFGCFAGILSMALVLLLPIFSACPPPPKICNGHLIRGHAAPCVPGMTVTYTCDPGYLLVGKAFIFCTHQGTWSQFDQDCKAMIQMKNLKKGLSTYILKKATIFILKLYKQIRKIADPASWPESASMLGEPGRLHAPPSQAPSSTRIEAPLCEALPCVSLHLAVNFSCRTLGSSLPALSL